MTDHHSFSVIPHRYRQSYSRDDQTYRFLTEQLEIARTEIAHLQEADLGIPERVEASANLFMALDHLDRFIPEVEGWVCGYWWGGSRADYVDSHPPHWSSFSAHNTKEHADSWLPYWRAEVPSRGADMWLVRRMPCQIGKFVKGGPPPIPDPQEAQ
jgi:hypothetical protein